MKKLCLVLAVMVSLVWVQNAVAGQREDEFLKKLQSELHKRGDPWIAGKTSVSDLPLAEKKKMLGLLPIPEYPRIKTSGRKLVKNPPATLDWRNNNGNWMTSAKSQGSCGSCWAFPWVGAQEARTKIFWNDPTTDIDLSEAYVIRFNPYGYS